MAMTDAGLVITIILNDVDYDRAIGGDDKNDD